MKRTYVAIGTPALAVFAAIAFAADAPASKPPVNEQFSGKFFKAEESVTNGSAAGVSYTATAGTLVVHPKDWNDAAQAGGDKNPDAKDDSTSAEASMFFVYYARKGVPSASRPITFLFNGGPG